MEEALEKLGIVKDGWGYSDANGLYWELLDSALWGGLLGFCCCGDRDQGLKIIKEVLEAVQSRKFKDEYLFHYYVFDKLELTEHGFTIYSSWLSPKGELLLSVLQKMEL